ncbi:hypothetical protein [Pontibacillus sp. HMF3514]|uniref:hypothetical protein n=1 Tax=Pontibacillus sp. HMF3514 TaxID=2692425 RepID=UPI00131F988F|nr:hypothetical protein [Pontibacillus sp. HMF3514]QHE50816.1 hypothetical protein GS400_01510 [Pontibacillus sp. HMF3514]
MKIKYSVVDIHVYFVGRKKEMIITGDVYHLEVEGWLEAHEGIFFGLSCFFRQPLIYTWYFFV